MPDGFTDELVDFETPDGRRRLMRRTEAERFAQEGSGRVIERNVPTQMEAQGPTEDLAFDVPSLQEVQQANPLFQPTGPGGLLPDSLEAPAAPSPSFPSPTPQPPTGTGPGGLILSSLETPVDPSQAGFGTDPIDADEGPQAFEEQLELSRQNVAAGIAPSRLNPDTGEPQPALSPTQAVTAQPSTTRSPRQSRSSATGPVEPSQAQLLVSDFNTAEENLVRTQQAAELLKAQGFEDQANTIMQGVADTEAFVNQRREALEAERQENDTARAAREKRIAELESEIMATDISDKRNLGQRLLGGLMIGLFQAGSTIAGQGGTPNAALNIIQSAVRRDLDSQKAALGKLQGALRAEKNELGQLVDAMGSIEAAELKLEEIRLGQVKNKLASLAARSQSAVVKQNAKAMDEQLELTRAQRGVEAENARQQAEAKIAAERRTRAFQRQQTREKQAFELKKIGLKGAIAQANTQAANAAKQGDRFSKEVSDIGKEFVKSGAGEMAEALNQARDVMIELDTNPNNFFGATGSRIPFIRRWVASDTKRAAQAQRQVKLIMQRLLTGKAGSDSERAEIGRLMGVNWDSSPEEWSNAMNLIHNMNRRKSSEVRGQNPRAFDQFIRNVQEGQAQPIDPRFRKVSGFRAAN